MVKTLSKLLDVPGPQETLDLGEPAAHLKESSLFELHLTFMTIDEHGEARDAGDGVVQLCDHSMRMMQLLEDVACDTLQAPHEWICKARGYDEWLVGDKPLIDYRYKQHFKAPRGGHRRWPSTATEHVPRLCPGQRRGQAAVA